MTDNALPQQFPHFFIGIPLSEIGEVSYPKLEELSQLAKARSAESEYDGLVDALKKLFWAKSAALTAIDNEEMIASVLEKKSQADKEKTMYSFPAMQTLHEKSIADMLVYIKSSLDSICLSLDKILNLSLQKQQRDFKHEFFRSTICHALPSLKSLCDDALPWVTGNGWDSITYMRDEWVHRVGAKNVFVQNVDATGHLPIVFENQSGQKIKIGTQSVTDFHMIRGFAFFNQIVDSLVLFERRKNPNLVVQQSPSPISGMMTEITKPIVIDTMSVNIAVRLAWPNGIQGI